MTAPRILFVDDDPNILAGFKRTLHRRYEVVTAQSGEDGLKRLASDGPFAVVVADMGMPGMNGVRFLQAVQDKFPDAVRLMLTGNADQKTAADAVNQGRVFSFLTKPCPPEVLEIALANAIKQHALITAEKELLENTLNGAIKVLMEILSIADPVSFGRAERLRMEMKAVAASFRAPRPWELEMAAMLSQIGFVTVPAPLLRKARSGAPLSGPEQDVLRRVPESGAALLKNVPRLESVAEIVRYQEKNFDGSGFPFDAAKGDQIPIGARILRVLNDLIEGEDAKQPRADVFKRMRESAAVYDPSVLDAVAACFDILIDASASAQEADITVGLPDLAAGDILNRDVRTKEGTFLVQASTTVTPALLEKLRNFSELYGLEGPIHIRRGHS